MGKLKSYFYFIPQIHYIPHISQSALTLFLMPSFLPNTYARVLYSKKYLRHIVLHDNCRFILRQNNAYSEFT